MSDFHLAPSAIDAGYKVSSFENIGSTSTEAMRAAKTGVSSNHWFVSAKQSAGRGRMGREWQSVKGNLAASLLFRTNLSPMICSSLSFVAALAVYRAIIGAEVNSQILLKWPNDILAMNDNFEQPAKLVGILLESQILPSSEQALVIGFGVNIVSAPKNLPYPATCLTEIGSEYNAKEFFESLSKHWYDVFEIWDNGVGIRKILDLWRQNAAGIGKSIAITNHGKTVSGIFEDIDETGRLVIRTNAGQEFISAGDVHFGDAASLREL